MLLFVLSFCYLYFFVLYFYLQSGEEEMTEVYQTLLGLTKEEYKEYLRRKYADECRHLLEKFEKVVFIWVFPVSFSLELFIVGRPVLITFHAFSLSFIRSAVILFYLHCSVKISFALTIITAVAIAKRWKALCAECLLLSRSSPWIF